PPPAFPARRSSDLAEAARLAPGELHHAPGARRYRGGLVAGQAVAAAHHALDLGPEPLERPAELGQDLAGGPALAHEAEEEVLRTDHGVPELAPLLAREVADEPGSVVVAVHGLLRARPAQPERGRC